MVEVGVLAVGPASCALDFEDLGVPVLRVAAEPVRPVEEDLTTLVVELGPSLFADADGDRWRLLPTAELPAETAMLWTTSQVATADPGTRVQGWRKVLLVADAAETAVVPTLRTLPPGLQITVLLGGLTPAKDPDVRRNLVALTDRSRRGEVTAIIYNPEPGRVLDVALDTARTPTPLDHPHPPTVDVGSRLGLPPVHLSPEPEVPLFQLVDIPLGMARQLDDLLRDIAAREALLGLLHGPPVDVEGVPVVDLEALRETLPDGELFESYRQRALETLGQVRFRGEEPLVEGIARALRPLQSQLLSTGQTAASIESHRILRMRAFGAAGIHFTAQRLRTQLDDVGTLPAPPGLPDLHALLSGELPVTPAGIHPLAWRQVFAGVPSYVVRRGQPGWQVARQLVQERFSRFKGEFAAALATAAEQTVHRARDPRAPLPTPALRELHLRAERVRDALDAVVADLDGRILAGSEIALRQDGLLRWVCREPEAFRERLQRLVARDVVAAELERFATVALTRRPLGMADPTDFERYLEEVVEAAESLPKRASMAPDYERVLLTLLSDRDPAELRAHLARDGVDPTLFIRPNTSPGLLEWLNRTGMRVEVREGEPRALHWRTAEGLTDPEADRHRLGTREHQLSDFVLPPPEGDTAASLAALAESCALILAGLAVGELALARVEGVESLLLRGALVPPRAFLPFGAVHALAQDTSAREALRQRVEGHLDHLAAFADGSEALQKLVEISALGPSPRVRQQVGLDHPRLSRLTPAVDLLLQQFTRRGTVSMLEHVRADEVLALVERPGQHAIRDLLQLAPLGA